jgi:serine protease inhibitor
MDINEQSASPSTRFTFKLFRQLASEQEDRNLFWSPASVMLCLWMLHDGATGHTREAMATVLAFLSLIVSFLFAPLGNCLGFASVAKIWTHWYITNV